MRNITYIIILYTLFLNKSYAQSPSVQSEVKREKLEIVSQSKDTTKNKVAAKAPIFRGGLIKKNIDSLELPKDTTIRFSYRDTSILGQFGSKLIDTMSKVLLNTRSLSNEPSVGGNFLTDPSQYKKDLVGSPSPNLTGLSNQISASSDLFTGKVNASAPIYVLKSHDIQVPVTLSNVSNGVKLNDMGSWVGQGWNCTGGGAITRIMKNSPDESIVKVKGTGGECEVQGYWYCGSQINYFDNLPEEFKKETADRASWYPPHPLEDGRSSIGFDSEPDEFQFSFGNYSGKFVFNSDKQIICIPDYKFQISYSTRTFNRAFGGGTMNKIVSFTITTVEGMKYTFGDYNLESVESSTHKTYSERYYLGYDEAGWNLTNNTIDYYRYKALPKYVSNIPWFSDYCEVQDFYTSTWYLKNITSISGDAVNLKYSDGGEVEYVNNKNVGATFQNFRESESPYFNIKPTWSSATTDISNYAFENSEYNSNVPHQGQEYARKSSLEYSVSATRVKVRYLTEIETATNIKLTFTSNTPRVDLFRGKLLDEISLSISNQTPIKKWKLIYENKTFSDAEIEAFKATEQYEYIKETPLVLQKFFHLRNSYINYSWKGIKDSKIVNGDEAFPGYQELQENIYKAEFSRTLLKSVIEVGDDQFTSLDLYKFTYYNEDKKMSKRFSFEQDNFGYFNGFTNRDLLDLEKKEDGWYKALPLFWKRKNVKLNNLTTNLNLVKTYSLKEVKNHLGGSFTYDYAVVKPNVVQASRFDVNYGELKVSSITTKTGSEVVNTKNFSYQDNTIGFTLDKNYPISSMFISPTKLEGATVCTSNYNDVNGTNGSLIQSGTVVVTDGVIKTTSKFRINSELKKVTPTILINSIYPPLQGRNYPFTQPSDYQWDEGQQLSFESISNVSTKSSNNAYQVFKNSLKSRGLKGALVRRYIRVKENDFVINIEFTEYRAGIYTYESVSKLPTITEEKERYAGTSVDIIKKTETTYATQNLRVRTAKTTNSDGKEYIESYKYAFDYPQIEPQCISYNPELGYCDGYEQYDPFVHSYFYMVYNHMISIPVEKFINNGLGGGQKIVYGGQLAPTYFFKYGNHGNECNSPENHNNWYLQYKITQFDSYNRPKEIKYACNDNLIYLWWEHDLIKKKLYLNREWGYDYFTTNRMLKKSTNFDGLFSEFEYDPLLRLKKAKGRNSGITSDYIYTFGNGINSIQTKITYDGTLPQTFTTDQFVDGIGRATSTNKKGVTASGGDYISSVKYDLNGRVIEENEPSKGRTAGITVYENGAASRVLSKTPNGSSRPINFTYGLNDANITVDGYTYLPNTLFRSTVVDENNNESSTFTDKLGRTIMTRKVFDKANNKFADTKYVYNDRGQVVKVLPPDNGEQFLYEYYADGSLKRKHVPGTKKNNDGTFTWMEYTYDSRDRLFSSKDPKGDIVKNYYNDFDEPTELKVNDDLVKRTTYGTLGILKGKPTKVETKAFETNGNQGRLLATTLEYDTYGRPLNSVANSLKDITFNTMTYNNALDQVGTEKTGCVYNLFGANSSMYSIQKSNAFDNGGRNNKSSFKFSNFVSNVETPIGNTPQIINEYSDNGWLKKKNINEVFTFYWGDYGRSLQTIDYSYNDRGWLTAINDPRQGSASINARDCGESLDAAKCFKKASNFYATIDFNPYTYCWGSTPADCFSYGVSDLKVNYSFNFSDYNNNSETRSKSEVLMNNSGSSYYTKSTYVNLNIDVRLDNFEAALEEITTEFWNVLQWRATGPQTGGFQADLLKASLKDRMRTELYKQYCQESDKLFAEKIHYEDGNATLNAPNQYNGNISWVETQVGNRRKQAFGYQYDNLDRLTNSQFADTKMDGTFNTTNNKYNESIVYEDLRGNIKNLTRRGVYTGYSYGGTTYYCHGDIDKLTYTYDDNTNKLIGINDVSGQNQGVKSGNWAYEYDVNGNMLKDYSKGLTIKYNYLNLPYEFTFATGARIYMTYNADGRKLRKDVYSPQGVLTQYDYAGQFEYKDGIMESINWGTGRLIKDKVANTHRMEYFLQDHLGNTRVTFADVDNNGVINGNNEIVQENHYYAFGMNMQGAWNNMSVSGSPKNNYQYNGKEWNQELGLNDYGARWYDPAVGRWSNIDPISDKYSNLSNYTYVANNPIKAIDPDGKRILFINGHYQDNFIGREIIGSDKCCAAYWGGGFKSYAQDFFQDFNPISDLNFIDGSSMVGFDQSGSERYQAGYNYAKDNFAALTAGMSEGETFKIITHSEGAAYGSGITQFLLDKGVPVETVVHLSGDEGDEFSTPEAPMTYQLGYNGDWLTGNHQIKGVDKFGLVNSGLSWNYVHGSTRSFGVFKELKDLKTVTTQDNIGTLNGSYAAWRSQILSSIKFGTDFTNINGVIIKNQDGSIKQ
jgi:RHS repeat-associated protein